MNPSEAARLLAVAVTFDARLSPPTEEDGIARAQAWAAALDDDMDLAFATRTVVAHYAESTDVVMPAMVNRRWRDHLRSQSQDWMASLLRQEQEKARQAATPMPPQIRDQINRVIHRSVG